MATAISRATGAGQRLATETKQAFKTTEFWAYVGVLAMLLIAGAVTSGDVVSDEADSFPADDVWLYATILTIGYMISRGLAKAGSRNPYTAEPAGSTDGAVHRDREEKGADALSR